MGNLRMFIGFLLVLICGPLGAVTGFFLFHIIMFIGVFLFASFPSEAVFYDYRIANSDTAILRKRYYIIFMPFTVLSLILTLGTKSLVIAYKEEYLKKPIGTDNKDDFIKISRKEYIAIRNEQRIIYSTQTLSKEFMESSYDIRDIGFARKKLRLIIASVFAAIFLFPALMFVPDGIYISLVYEALLVPMIILWIPDYKDAKILQQAYDRAVKSTTQTNDI